MLVNHCDYSAESNGVFVKRRGGGQICGNLTDGLESRGIPINRSVSER